MAMKNTAAMAGTSQTVGALAIGREGKPVFFIVSKVIIIE
jgi:hypothetical protein